MNMATAVTQVANQNLECPVCLSFFKDPKILSCSHTFCKGCLDTLLESHQDKQSLSCPVCRGVTPVPDGDVSTLQANIALRSLVADVESQGQLCANCPPEDRIHAVVFCKDCGEYLCESCRTFHSKWSKFSGHSVVSASDVLSGKIPLKRRYKCQKHQAEDEECFCFTCGIYVCFRCGVLEHTHQGHKIAEAYVHESEQQKSIDELTSKSVKRKDVADEFIACVTEQREKMQKVQTKLNDDIEEAFADSVKKLTERKELLKSEIGQQMTEAKTFLAGLENKTREQIVKVTAMCGLVENGLRVPLQKEALIAHTTLCQDLEEILDRFEPDNKELRTNGEECERLCFERSKESNRLELGRVFRGEHKWLLVADKKLPTPASMRGMTASPDNTMSIGYKTGGILTYSADGHLQETLMENVKVRRLAYFMDGRFVVRHTNNQVILYTHQLDDIATCHTLRNVQVMQVKSGGLTIDKNGHVIIGYTQSNKMLVFTSAGGNAVREIPCHNFAPQQIFAMYSSQMIVVKSDSTVHVVDGVSGVSLYSITKDGLLAFPTVCRDDSVMIAWVKHEQGLVSFALYTQELEFKKTLISEFKIAIPGQGSWYYLQLFTNGEIALCTPDSLYIFKEILA